MKAKVILLCGLLVAGSGLAGSTPLWWHEAVEKVEGVEGGALLTAVGSSQDRVDEILSQLGVSGKLSSPVTTVDESKGVQTTVIQTAASRSTIQFLTDQKSADGWLKTERTEVLGRALSVQVHGGPRQTLVVTDDFGGQRTEAWRSDLGLLFADDETGQIVSIEYDEHQRPYRATVGNVLWLQYIYADEGSTAWIEKRLIRKADGLEIGRWRVAPSGLKMPEGAVPRSAARLWAPNHGFVAEWDEELHPDGRMVATLNARPYALLPLTGNEVEWRSIELVSVRHYSNLDRVDYSDEEFRLWIHLGGGSRAEEVVVVTHPRDSR